ncbi:MAG: DUF1080 domain-containing protein [Pirellulaceae bacterium]|jgi:hypothetical protein|nr:DUF1080 domain-containing protein [Pirellulaceae bacterium]MDP7017724.1 DUF1080 domain-containing protein [Pirellulaceae bacterium]
MRFIICIMLVIAVTSVGVAADNDFKPLFDGKSLDGWTPTPGGKWEVSDGSIVGTSDKSERRHGILLSNRTYSDFEVKAKFRVIAGDSGFYFRAGRVKSGVSVNGFQVEVDTSQETGGLYETGGRAWVHQPTADVIEKRKYKPGEWTELELSAVGEHIVVKINGVVTSELKKDKGRREGHFGLQLHGGQDMHVEFRDIAIREVRDASGFTEMFNGKDLTGWTTTGNWVVEKDNTITLKPRPGESGWQRYKDYLTTNRKYGDFVLDLEFKFDAKGNSGVFMRVGDLKNHVTSGFEVQILDTYGKQKFGAHDCGGVIGTSGPSKMMVKPAGQWNRYTITLKGDHLQVVLNGERIQDFDLSQTKLKDRPAQGYISFQDEAKRIWYRNVRIKELK